MRRLLPTRWGLSLLEALFVLAAVVVICVLIQQFAPSSGLAKAIHAGFHVFALALQWLATGLNYLAALLNQL